MQVHPAQISPSESFDIFYFLRNHTDATTYYVRGVVYDVRTGDILATHTLDQAATNPRLFIKTVEAPADPSGYGRNIVAIATVYTDAGYTTKAEGYEEQEAYYLVKAFHPVMMGGGGASARDIREIFQEELKTALGAMPAPETPQMPDAPDMSFVQGIFGALGAIQREINRIPKDAADFGPLSDKIDDLRDALDERPRFERTDLSSLAEGLQSAVVRLDKLASDTKLSNAQIAQVLDSALRAFKTEFETAIGAKIDEAIQGQEITLPMTMRLGRRKEEASDADPIAAVRGLMS